MGNQMEDNYIWRGCCEEGQGWRVGGVESWGQFIDINGRLVVVAYNKKSVWMQDRQAEEIAELKNQDPEPHTLETTSSIDALEVPPARPQPETAPQDPHSTRLAQLPQLDLPLRGCYRLHSRILCGTPVTETMRAKLRSFLMEEGWKQCLLRETLALACTLADLYFARGGTVPVQDFQTLVLACLILAAKLREGKFPTISFQAFSRQQLMAFEKQVAARLAYNLTPPTYHDIAERTVLHWDAHTLQEGRFHMAFAHTPVGVNFPLRRFYEQLDCAFMVLRTLDYDIEDLVVNLFYINVRTASLHPDNPPPPADQFDAAFYPPDDFRLFFEGFMQIYSREGVLLNPRIGAYLRPFLGVRSAQQEWTIRGGVEALERMRQWDQVQSVPQGNYQLAKSVIQRNNARNAQLKN